MLNLFNYDHLPENLQKISKPFRLIAADMQEKYSPKSKQYQYGMQKLLEAKDCFVRCEVEKAKKEKEEKADEKK